ncbi:MAG: cobalamin biosynthesis protein CobD/CbiB, partial [Nitrospirales bacterium]
MTAGELIAACVLDAAIGDPRGWPHPVRWMGWVIAQYERRIQTLVQGATGKRVAGLLLAVGLPLLVYGVVTVVIAVSARVDAWAGTAATVLLAFWSLAARDLHDHARAVAQALTRGSLEEAREAVARIVGRETRDLDEEGVVRAAVETVAESTADGYVAPLFYLVVGGPPLALAYKAVNTLDSMVGHRTPRYEQIGWASARL